jgi:cation:H+ antiporter
VSILFTIILWFVVLAIALTVLLKSADYFIYIAEKLGYQFNVPSFIIGATVVAFGTSLPELAVGVISVLGGEPDIVTGTVVGSNISNILFITGIAILMSAGFFIQFKAHRVEFLLLVFATILATYFLWDKELNLIEALICLLLLIIYLVYVVGFSSKNDKPEVIDNVVLNWKNYAYFILSILGVWVGAKYTTDAITSISSLLHLGSDVISQTVVALGTSLPELAVTAAAARKKHFNIILGNVMGSNIFNLLAVLGLPAFIGIMNLKPYYVEDSNFNQFSLPIMLAATFLLLIASFFKPTPRSFGVLFILLYIFFMVGSFLGINLLELV